MKKFRLKEFIKSHAVLYNFFLKIHNLNLKRRSIKNTKIIHKGIGKLRKDIIGKNNYIEIEENSYVHNLYLKIHGNNNKLIIGKNCKFGKRCSIWLGGENLLIEIKKGTTFTLAVHINAAESNSKIEIGEDCMFANNIIIRNSDGHPIIDRVSNKRINYPKDVIIGNHVWVAPNVKIMKGAYIPNDCIVGSDTTVSKKFEKENCLIIGRPSRIAKEDIYWLRHLSDYNG